MIGKICLLLGVSASVALGFRFEGSVDKTKVQEILGEWNNFKETNKNELQGSTFTLQMELAEIFENAKADVQVHYGRVVQPVAQKYAELLKTMKVNKDLCDERCIVEQCFQPNSWVMNYTCVINTCNCGLEDLPATMNKFSELNETVAQQ